jgi:hypothetical protein
MTTPRCCGVCGGPVGLPFRAPPPELAPDLDLRPGEPTRSTLPRWVETCPHCQAAAPDLAALPSQLRSTVDSPIYRNLPTTCPSYALPFLRWAALCPAAEAWLQAAWSADDAADTANAIVWRHAAAASWGATDDPAHALPLLDILRRAGDFAAAAAVADRLAGARLDGNAAAILAFQRARIAAGDSGRHLISSALRPPASKPHVAHTQPRKTNFWSRLFGA